MSDLSWFQTNKMPKVMSGGIGDMLQTIESAIEQKDFQVYTSFSQAKDFYEPFGLKPTITEFKIMNQSVFDAIKPFIDMGLILERNYFPKIRAPKESQDKVKLSGKVIGIHPNGSKQSKIYWQNFGFKDFKHLPVNFIEKILPKLKADKILLFGTKDELIEYESLKDRVQFVCEDKIWDSLAYVEKCSLIIGADSVIKTYANILKIPAIVFMEDTTDVWRDEHFIDPYKSTTDLIIHYGLDTMEEFNEIIKKY